MSDRQHPDGERNDKREQRSLSMLAEQQSNANHAESPTPAAAGQDMADSDVDIHEVRLIDVAQRQVAAQEPSSSQPLRTRPVLHLRKK